MENNNHYLHHLLIITFILLTTFTTCSSTTTTNTSTSIPPMAMQEINNILDALIGAGDTTIDKWVSILSMSNPLLSLTLFIPQQLPPPSSTPDPFIFPYHIIPQRLTFSELLLLPRYSRLPTLLTDKTISLTDNASGNFMLDDVLVTHPDLYNTSSLAVHGVKTLLDYTLYGDNNSMMNSTSAPFLPVGETWKSDALSAFAAINIFLLVFCFVLQEFFFFV